MEQKQEGKCLEKEKICKKYLEDKRCPTGILQSNAKDGRKAGDFCKDDGRFLFKQKLNRKY